MCVCVCLCVRVDGVERGSGGVCVRVHGVLQVSGGVCVRVDGVERGSGGVMTTEATHADPPTRLSALLPAPRESHSLSPEHPAPGTPHSAPAAMKLISHA